MPSRRVFISLLLALVVIAGVAVGIDELSQDAVHSDTTRPSLSDTRLGQADPLTSLLVQVTEQLNSSRDRINQLEAQLKQAPGPADLDKARKQGDELRSALAQATGQLKSTQDRINQLEAQLEQAPDPADLEKARQQRDELHSQLGQATERLKSSQDRIGQLEAQLAYFRSKRRPSQHTEACQVLTQHGVVARFRICTGQSRHVTARTDNRITIVGCGARKSP
jgi:chromosome segregation ATPase